MNKGRFESFSDAVFAFALTLLALGFVVPMNGAQKWLLEPDLIAQLLKLWPNLIAYALSFAVIGIMWQNHLALMRTVERIDRMTVFLNLLLLGCAVFIPFATATLGTYPTTHAATFLYGIVLTACSTCYNALLMHLVRRRAFTSEVDDQRIKGTITAYRVGWATYGGATLVALIAPVISFALYILIVGYYSIPRGVDADL